MTERRNSWKLRAATAHSWTWWTSSTVSQHSYLNRRLLTNPWPCVKKQQRITVHSSNFEQQNSRTTEWQTATVMTPPITLSTARRRARGLIWERDNPTWLHSDFICFSQFSQCNNGVNISFTSVYNLSLLYTYISLLYTCSNLLTVNMIALNTVPPGTGE